MLHYSTDSKNTATITLKRKILFEILMIHAKEEYFDDKIIFDHLFFFFFQTRVEELTFKPFLSCAKLYDGNLATVGSVALINQAVGNKRRWQFVWFPLNNSELTLVSQEMNEKITEYKW